MPTNPVTSVMVADDDPGFLAALVEFIDGEPGFEVVGAATTTAALVALARVHCPDVAVVDVRMPGGGAAEAAEALQVCCPRTAVVALSAYADRSAHVRLTAAGAVGPLAKGMPGAELLEVISAAVADRR